MLHDVAIFLAAAVVAVPLARALGFGSVLGYLAAGLALGPWALGLITDVDSILKFSEFGVVLLLFVIGLEMQPERFWRLRGAVFGSGGAQMLLTGVAIGGVAMASPSCSRADRSGEVDFSRGDGPAGLQPRKV
jgi:Kef-type K+ transport system membrane component KefB